MDIDSNKNLMWKYIDEQEDLIKVVIDSKVPKLDYNHKHVVIVASGSSYNSALIAKYNFKADSMKIQVVDPFDFRYYDCNLLTKDSLLIALSQTGKSIGTLECVQLANKWHVPTIALTSDDESNLAKEATLHINILCGDEPIGPKTKGVLAMTLMLEKVLYQLSGEPSDEMLDTYIKESLRIADTVSIAKQWCENNREWSKATCMSIVGYGNGNAIAREGSLKILETLRIPIMNFNMEEFMHGPHRTIKKNSFLIYLRNNSIGHELMDNLINFTENIGSKVLVISDKDAEDNSIVIESIHEKTRWIQELVVLQVLSAYLPEMVGINPSDPVYGSFAKTVGTRI